MQVLSAVVGLSALFQVGAAGLEPAPQPPTTAPAPASVTPSASLRRVAAGTPLQVELVNAVSSATAKLGDRFSIRLVEPIVVDGAELVAAGATGEGEVIDAAHKGMSGKQGKLIISARFLDIDGRQVRVRGMSLMGSGKSHVDLATGVALVPYVGLTSMFITGGEIELPAGARATVRLAEDLDLPVKASVGAGGAVK